MTLKERVQARASHLMYTEGFTPLRAYRRLKSEFPSAEQFDLKTAVGNGLTGVTPWWADRSGHGRSVVIRNDPRKFPTKE